MSNEVVHLVVVSFVSFALGVWVQTFQANKVIDELRLQNEHIEHCFGEN